MPGGEKSISSGGSGVAGLCGGVSGGGESGSYEVSEDSSESISMSTSANLLALGGEERRGLFLSPWSARRSAFSFPGTEQCEGT